VEHVETMPPGGAGEHERVPEHVPGDGRPPASPTPREPAYLEAGPLLELPEQAADPA